jgi:dTDP-4-amino-4,6-dideoxygalactose transaminase
MRIIRHSRPSISIAALFGIGSILRSGFLVKGMKERKFRDSINRVLPGEEAPLITDSGSKAIRCALELIRNDELTEVILPSYVCSEVLVAIQSLGLTPIFVDVEPCGFISLTETKHSLSSKTLAIIIPQLYGRVHNLSEFLTLGPYVIEDSCQNFDTTELKAHFRTYSLGATKMITSIRGGILLSNLNLFNTVLAKEQVFPSYRLQLNELESAIGMVQIQKIAKTLRTRKRIRAIYDSVGIEPLPEPHDAIDQSFRYMIKLNGTFEEFEEFCMARGIIVRKGVDELLHQRIKLPDDKFLNSVSIFSSYASLPIYPALSWVDILRIRKCLKSYKRMKT